MTPDTGTREPLCECDHSSCRHGAGECDCTEGLDTYPIKMFRDLQETLCLYCARIRREYGSAWEE